MKRIVSVLIVICLFISVFTGCNSDSKVSDGNTRIIIDCANREVAVPKEPKSICVMCPFSGPVVVMMGYGDKVSTAVNNMTRSHLLTTIAPSIKDIPVIKNSGSFNAEEIIKEGTDLIFVNSGTYETKDERRKLDSLNIPYVVVGFDSLESQLDAIEVIGEALGEAKRADEYIIWCKEVYESCGKVAKENNNGGIRLYHAVNEATRTDMEGDICSQWIGITGAKNVSHDAKLAHEGDKAYTTLEQIYIWDPEIIICNEPGVDDYILTDEKWRGLSSVKEEKVFQIPVGIARMGHPTSTETPLALLWLTKLLYDNSGIDVKEEIKNYYTRFYDYHPDDKLIEAIFSGDEMRDPKTESRE